jgi:hypothetical protein
MQQIHQLPCSRTNWPATVSPLTQHCYATTYNNGCSSAFHASTRGNCLTTASDSNWSVCLQSVSRLLSRLYKPKSKLYYGWRSAGQSVLVSSSIRGPRPDFSYCQTAADLLIWGAFSQERAGLSLTSAAHPCQRSHSWVREPRDSWPHLLSQSQDSLKLEGQVPVFVAAMSAWGQASWQRSFLATKLPAFLLLWHDVTADAAMTCSSVALIRSRSQGTG